MMLDLCNSCGHTPFYVAIIKNYLDLASFLLENQMSTVNCQDNVDDTPLHWAVVLDNMAAVKLLL